MIERTPPANVKSGLERIYRVARYAGETGRGGSFRFEIIARRICYLLNREGRFVRYANHWHPLHEVSKLRSLFAEIRDSEAITYLSHANRPFVQSRDERLPFIKEWDSPLGYYPEALSR